MDGKAFLVSAAEVGKTDKHGGRWKSVRSEYIGIYPAAIVKLMELKNWLERDRSFPYSKAVNVDLANSSSVARIMRYLSVSYEGCLI